MRFERCSQCDRYDFTDSHTCGERWRIWIDGYHDPADEQDGHEVYAHDAENAARDGVQRWDECERDVLRCEVHVLVRPADNFAVPGEWFVVSAEAVIEYSAHPCGAPSEVT